jgi:hypothetical protein
MSSRFEGTADTGNQLRIKLGAGFGSEQFGAPESRVLFSIEMFNRNR